MNDKIEYIRQFLQLVKSANKELTKKEAFKDLLNRLYRGNDEIRKVIDKMTLGAETTILNIPRKDKLHRGSADTLYNNIIIEFENDLKVTYTHAKEQLAGYMLGRIRSGEGYDFTLIASDFVNWKILTPDISCLDHLETLQEHEVILNETSFSFTLTDVNAEDFYWWLDRFLFTETKQRATLLNVEQAFGLQSNIFIESYRELSCRFNEAKKYGEIQVSFEQWHKFLSIAYGKFEMREDAFVIHTYLSVFAKMLAYSVLSNDDYIDDEEMLNILDGSIFNTLNIANFVDNDFFYWVSDSRNFPKLKKVFRLIAHELSMFDFENVNEDILKGVYQELIDLDTRHQLGEYYTPDWLCERMVREFDFDQSGSNGNGNGYGNGLAKNNHNGKKILDPSCGSGSFLRAAIQRIKQQNPEKTPEEINRQVYGIDIHPLSVQIAKTTVLLALGKDIRSSQKPVFINVLLANTLYSPINERTLWGVDFKMPIDNREYKVNSSILDNVAEFNQALEMCDQLSSHGLNEKPITFERFSALLHKQISNNSNSLISESYYEIYKGLKLTKEQKRDSIWKFIISNLYKPYGLYGFFDYVIGNPPWLTYSSINNEDYQNILNDLALKYNVRPTRSANYPHLEIAAIFLTHCSSYFLKETGKLAFVLPRSFFSGDQHDRTRSGEAKGFKINELWDFEKVQPLFRIPSCALFAEKKNGKQNGKTPVIAGLQFEGRLPSHNCHYDVAETRLKETKVEWHLRKQGHSTAFSTTKSSSKAIINEANPYKLHFKQGATITPRMFYFVDIQLPHSKRIFGDTDSEKLFDITLRGDIIPVKTSSDALSDAKAPWKMNLSGQVERKFLFRTALAKSVLPFYLHQPAWIILPVTIEKEADGLKRIHIHSSAQLMDLGEFKAWRWFENAEMIWKSNCTEKNKKTTMSDYLNWRNKLTTQNLNARYLTLYTASAKDANAVVFDRQTLEYEFIVESKTYVFYTNDESEAFYLASFLNSAVPNMQIKDFQTRGLFGPRDIHKKILDVYFPKFNASNKQQLRLAELGKICAEKTKAYITDNQPKNNLAAHSLGKLRMEIKRHISEELSEIDVIVKKLM
ncbi:MAG: N-6 DNA methylase [Tannerella sp.]|jgi:type I restriction-modification system DNA methylase subunit|nr:N-6 DNA methylase [Tannerella sp.]